MNDTDKLVQEIAAYRCGHRKHPCLGCRYEARRLIESPSVQSLIEKANQLEELHVKDSVRTREHNLLVKENRDLTSRIEATDAEHASTFQRAMEYKQRAEKLETALWEAIAAYDTEYGRPDRMVAPDWYRQGRDLLKESGRVK